MTEKKQKELQNILVHLESNRRQVESINKQIQLLDSAMSELRSTTAALEALNENKVGAELLVNLGSNSFMRATLKDNQKVMVGVGGDVSIEKTIPEAKEILEKRATEFTKTLERLQKSAMELSTAIENLNQMAEKLAQELKT